MFKLNSGVCTLQILWECVPNCWSAQMETGSQAKSTTYIGQRGHRGLLVIIANEQQRCLQDVRQRLVSALVLSRVDYCNSLLAGLPATALAPLQRVLNVATCYQRLWFVIRFWRYINLFVCMYVCTSMRPCDISPAFPAQRTQYKLCILMYGAAHGYAPDYIANLVTLTSATSGRSHLCSADSLAFEFFEQPLYVGIYSRPKSKLSNCILSDIHPHCLEVYCLYPYAALAS